MAISVKTTGASGLFASIVVTAPTGSTVTMRKIATETKSGDGTTTAFVLTNLFDSIVSVSVASTELQSGYIYDTSTHTLSFTTAPESGTNNITIIGQFGTTKTGVEVIGTTNSTYTFSRIGVLGTYRITATKTISGEVRTQYDDVNVDSATQFTTTIDLGRLPLGYTEVEYIQSTGTQSISTNIIGGTNAEYQIQFENGLGIVSTDDTYFFAPSSVGTPFILKAHNSINNKTRFSSYSGTMIYKEISDGNFTAQWNKSGTLIVNDTSYSDFASRAGAGWGTTQPWHLFSGCSNAGTIKDFSIMKLFYCKMFTNDVLVRDFVPCINPSNEVGLYDLVSNAFFSNAGTGVFIAGQPV